MAFAKFLIVFLALIVAVCATNTTTPSTQTWYVTDSSSVAGVSLLFWVPVSGNGTQQQAYQLTVPGSKAAAAVGAYGAGAFSKNFTVSDAKNGTSATWSFSGDTTGKTYFTATVTYQGPIPTAFTFNTFNVSSDGKLTPGAISTTNPSTSEAFFNNKDAFFEIKSASTTFTTNSNATATATLNVYSVGAANAVTVLVDFTAYPSVVNANTTSTTSTYTAYVGVGSPPGGHIVLIIIICVAAGVVLSVIIFVVIYLRRRRNYERID